MAEICYYKNLRLENFSYEGDNWIDIQIYYLEDFIWTIGYGLLKYIGNYVNTQEHIQLQFIWFAF